MLEYRAKLKRSLDGDGTLKPGEILHHAAVLRNDMIERKGIEGFPAAGRGDLDVTGFLGHVAEEVVPDPVEHTGNDLHDQHGSHDGKHDEDGALPVLGQIDDRHLCEHHAGSPEIIPSLSVRIRPAYCVTSGL